MANDTAAAHAWLDLGPLDAFPEGKATLRKADGQRFACVRVGGDVHAVDDRCPHEGYPLSQGDVAGGVLTCAWHNWKFDLGSGACTFGGEAVKRYPVRVEDGRVHLDVAVDVAAETARFAGGVRAAVREDATGRALREALRLGAVAPAPALEGLGRLDAGFGVLIEDAADRAEHGFDHALAVSADLVSWASRGWITAEEAFALAAHAVGEASQRLDRRARFDGHLSDPLDAGKLVDALAGERRLEAEARARCIAEERGPDEATRALLGFAARHLFDYGHGAIFLAKGRELARRFPSAAGAIFGSVAAMLAWATAETALPPFAATRAALGKLSPEIAKVGKPFARVEIEAAVLAGERAGVDAVAQRLEDGADPLDLLRAVAHAAAVRLGRFDAAWERRMDVSVGVLDVTHVVTFAEAAIALSDVATPAQRARFAVLAAGFVGKVKKADRPEALVQACVGATLDAAIARRDACAALDATRGMSRPGRLDAFRAVAPFSALSAAVRPIFYAHCVKNAEALRRLDEGDASDSGAYLEALLAYVIPPHPENAARRTAAVASKFMEDGRPPEGLY